MKKVLAGSVVSALLALPSFGFEIYNNDGTKLDIYGSIRGYIGVGHNLSATEGVKRPSAPTGYLMGLQNNSRFGINFSTGDFRAQVEYGWVFAQGVSAVLCFVYSVKKFPVMAVTLSDFRCSFKFMWEHLKVGTAMAIQSSLTSISVMILQTAINNLGDAAIKAYSAAGKVSYLSMQPVVNLGFAAATFAAQNYGAKRIDRIKLCVKKGVPVCILLGLLGAAVMIFGGDFFLFIFGVDTSETAVYEYTHQFLYALGGFYVLLGLWHFFRNMLQGMGKTIVPTVSSLVEVVVRIALSFWLSASWGFTGVCFVDPFTWVVISVTHIIAYFVIMKKEEKIHI